MRPSLFLGKKSRKNTKTTRKTRTAAYRTTAAVEYKRAFERLFGSQGAASPVRKIDPVTGEVIEIIPARITPGEGRHHQQGGRSTTDSINTK